MLGNGGFGVVYKAKDGFDNYYAIKKVKLYLKKKEIC